MQLVKKARGIKVGTTAAKAVDSKGFTLWQVEKRENVEFTYVPFKGSSEILAALLGGHVGLYLSTSDASTLSFVQEGKIRILMYLSADKLPGYEHIPSVKEVYGTFPEGYELPAFLSVWGPKGLPRFAVKKLEDAFSKAVKDPDFIKIMGQMCMPVTFSGAEELTKYVTERYENTRKIYEKSKAELAQEKK